MCLKNNNNIIWTIIGIIAFIVLLIFILSPLTSCSNKMLIDTRYTYNVAYITSSFYLEDKNNVED